MDTFATPEDREQQENNERALLMRLIAFTENSGIPRECGDRICTLNRQLGGGCACAPATGL